MSNNNRIFYATQQVGIKADGNDYQFVSGDEVHGVQSVGMTTNFNLEQVFELGQLAIYDNIENLPDVEVTLNKVLDGYPLMWHMSTRSASSPTLSGRSTAKCIFGLSIFDDTKDSATGNPESVVACSGMFVNSLGYSFPLDDNFAEDVTLVGNNKVWANTPSYGEVLNPNLANPTFTGLFTTNADSPANTAGVNRRQHLIFDFDSGEPLDANGMVADSDTTILPPEVRGISNSGTNEKSNGLNFDASLSNLSVSVDLAREEINELGRRGPYHRSVTFPIEVSCEIEVTSKSGDWISATEDGIFTTGTEQCDNLGNLKDRTIRIATCEGTRLYLGIKNKLSAVNYSGGDAGGGNVSVSYTFTTFNDLTVLHSGDPNSNGTTWWTNRDTHLRDL